MLTDDAEPESIASCANTWVQVSGLKKDLASARAPEVLVEQTRTKAATFNLGRSDFVLDAATQGTSQESKVMLKCKKIFADEVSQWRPGTAGYVNEWSQMHRKRLGESLGGWQWASSGGFEQTAAILHRKEYALAKRLGAMPREENMLEDDVMLDHPNMHVLNYSKVMRQEEERLASNFNNFGMGVVEDADWAVAQELFETPMSGEQSADAAVAVCVAGTRCSATKTWRRRTGCCTASITTCTSTRTARR